MSDLVCASSACPDDIDPANGWEITDVHVRVYAPENRFSMAIAHRVTPEAEPVMTQETAFHPAHRGAHAQPDRVPRLLAADLLHQRRRDRRVLGVPREGGGHGPLAAAQVGDPRPGRRGARPARDHARRAAALRRPGRLHGRLQRDGRHDRRRDGVPARARQLPLRRRRRVRRRAPQGAGRPARPARLGQAVDRPAAQPRRPGAAQPRDPSQHRLDAGHPARARGAQVVPLPRSGGSATTTGSRRRLAHGLHGRAGLRGVLPPRRRPGGVGRDHGRGRAARAHAARAGRARHAAHRVRA